MPPPLPHTAILDPAYWDVQSSIESIEEPQFQDDPKNYKAWSDAGKKKKEKKRRRSI